MSSLDACRPGPQCFYGPIYASYPTYGNFSTLGDCTFASVADWEQIVLHRRPTPAVIEKEFHQAVRQAGESASGGLNDWELFRYWRDHGIGGVNLTAANPVSIWQRGKTVSTWTARMEQAIRRYGALLVVFRFVNGDAFGQFFAPSGNHMAVVDGFTPEGPLIVTWGETIQLDWVDWYPEAIRAWRITTLPGAANAAESQTTPFGCFLVSSDRPCSRRWRFSSPHFRFRSP